MRARIDVVRMPLRAPVGHAQATRTESESVIVVLSVGGVEGAGECVPRPYVTGETVQTVVQAISRLDLGALLDGFEPATLTEAAERVEAMRLPERLAHEGRPGLAAACALEMAMLDAAARRIGEPLRSLARAIGLPREIVADDAAMRHEFEIGAILVDFTTDPGALQVAVRPDLVKVKVGRSPDWDVARVEAVRKALGADVRVAVDANMAWSLEQARTMVRALRPHAICWYEEPLARGALDDYRRLREETGAPIMLDESVCSFEEARRAIESRACDYLNVRISKCGGMLGALRIVELAHRSRIGYQLGCQIGEMALLEAAAWSLVTGVRGWVSYSGAGGHIVNFEEQIGTSRTGAGRHLANFERQIGSEALRAETDRASSTSPPAAGLGVTLAPDVIARFSVLGVTWSEHGWVTSRGA